MSDPPSKPRRIWLRSFYEFSELHIGFRLSGTCD